MGVYVGTVQLGGEVLPLGAGNLEGAAVLVFDLDALGHTVVDLGLALSAALRGFLQLVGQKQAAFQLNGGQVERGLMLAVAYAFHIFLGSGLQRIRQQHVHAHHIHWQGRV